jgi:hypothetical protein
VTNCYDNRPLTAFIASAISCWSVRCHDICVFTDRDLVVTIPHCFGCQGYFAYRTVESNLVVSVAWQWIFSTLDNSAFQTTCHNIVHPPASSLYFLLYHQYPICIPLLPHSCYMPRPSHSSWS